MLSKFDKNSELAQRLSHYFATRGEFLAHVICADMSTMPRYQHHISRQDTPPSNGHATNGHSTNGHSANGHSNGYAANGHIPNGHGHNTNGHTLNGHDAQGELPTLNHNSHSPDTFVQIHPNSNTASGTELSSLSGKIHSIYQQNKQNLNDATAQPITDLTDAHPVQATTQDLRQEICESLIKLIAEKTGYPPESVTVEARLLDDLNLDSIKAGELIASIARQYEVVGDLDPASLSQATIREVSEAIYNLSPRSETTVPSVVVEAKGSPDGSSHQAAQNAEQMLFELVEEVTGFPQSSLSPNMRLLDDLNLDSIKAADLVSKAAKKIEFQGQLDPAVLANATLADVALALNGSTQSQSVSQNLNHSPKIPLPPGLKASTLPKWVRNFGVHYVEESLVSTLESSWTQAKVNLIATCDDHRLVDVLARKMKSLGAQVNVSDISRLLSQSNNESYFDYTHYIVVLPLPNASVPASSSLPLQQMSERLKCLASPYLSGREYLTFVQFGGGYFGHSDECISPEFTCTAAFARSLHLERPSLRVRVVDLSAQLALEEMVDSVLAEVSSDRSIVTAGYDAQRVRRVPQSVLQQPATYSARAIEWTPDDVLLVTGGAKGITAECAFAIAQSSGVKMALVGRSTVPTNPESEISKTLERFKQQGLTAQYYSCDISNTAQVSDLFASITDELGPVTGVIHGAGLNTPKRVEQVSLDAAQAEMGPKLLGAQNILSHLETVPPKLFMAFTSIIGVTGMPGNTWYGFANETLSLMLRQFNAQHPQTNVISIAYSVWDEVGMGARMGSIKNLERMGIGAISPAEGVERCVQLFHNDPGTQQVIIAARLGGLDTWSPIPLIETQDLRFIENITHIEPGVEVTIRTHLNLDRDLYVKDHVWRDSYLFPTVFGLEAMSQAVAVVMGTSSPTISRLENISLRRPIVVNPEHGCDIEIHAEVTEQNTRGEQTIQIGIKTEQTGFSLDHFCATFVIGDRSPSSSIKLKDAPPLAIVPKRDLYGGLLFQGELFQQMGDIYALSREKSLLSAPIRPSEGLKDIGFPKEQGTTFILGDPYFRDVLLQCMQLNIPQDICLPVEIGRIDIFEQPALATGPRFISAILNEKVDQEYICEVISTDSSGTILEHLTGYRLRILEERPDNPTAADMGNPEQRDQAILEKALLSLSTDMGIQIPSISLGYSPQLGQKPKQQRRKIERPLVEQAIRKSIQHSSDPFPFKFSLRTQTSGKPTISSKELTQKGMTLDLSISHDEHYCLCSVGKTSQGCDIDVIQNRTQEEWLGLLTQARSQIFNQVLATDDDLDTAGMRIWSALEAIYKVENATDITLSIAKRQGSAILFSAQTHQQTYAVLTTPVQLTRRPARMVAVVVEVLTPPVSGDEHTVDPYGLIKPNEHRARITEDGPQNQAVFEKRFQATFKEACSISRKVSIPQYIKWVGQIREMPLKSIAGEMLPDFLGGDYGMVTNGVSIKILGEATTYDTIQARCWLGNLVNSSFSTYIEFCKVLPDETLVRIGMAEVRATWVRMVDYGIPKPDPLPKYLQEYMDIFASEVHAEINIREDSTRTLPALQQPLERYQVGPVEYEGRATTYGDPLRVEVFQTTLQESNVVGNVYYGNYFNWQSKTLDLFLYSIAPHYLRVSAAQGEILPLFSEMNYMREAMPFDRIKVQLYVKHVSQCGALFTFEFFRELPNQQLEKLHTGEQEVVWVQRQPDGTPSITPWPSEIRQALVNPSPKALEPSVALSLQH